MAFIRVFIDNAVADLARELFDVTYDDLQGWQPTALENYSQK